MLSDPNQRTVATALARHTNAFDAPPRRSAAWARRLVAALARYTDADLATFVPNQNPDPGQAPARAMPRRSEPRLRQRKPPDAWSQPEGHDAVARDPHDPAGTDSGLEQDSQGDQSLHSRATRRPDLLAEWDRMIAEEAKLLAARDRPDEAIRLLQTVDEIPTVRRSQILVELLLSQGRTDEAIAFLETNDAEGTYADLLAELLAQTGRGEGEGTRAPTGPSAPATGRHPAEPTAEPGGASPRGEETVSPADPYAEGKPLRLMEPEQLAMADPVVLYRAGGTRITTTHFVSGGYRFPLAELENFERVEHGGYLQSRLFEMWASFRGQRIRLFHSYNAVEFGQVARALTRAREHAGLA